MELRQIALVIKRRWWLIAGLTLVALLVAGLVELRGPEAYRADLRLVISVEPEYPTGQDLQYSPTYYAYLTSEYLADDLSELLKSEAFAQEVSRVVGFPVAPLSGAQVVRTKKTHRMIDLTVFAPTPDQARTLGEAYARVAQEQIPRYLKQFSVQTGAVQVLDRPIVSSGNPTLLRVANVLVRGVVGLLAGLGLAFLFEYLDNTVRDRREAEDTLGLPVIGEIPRWRTETATKGAAPGLRANLPEALTRR